MQRGLLGIEGNAGGIPGNLPDTTKDMQRGLLGIEGNAGGIPGNLREAN
ncbi:MAG: hypothetical protein UV01_C0015G0039 [Parcubacteria group bacterium GW2011_GWA2_42_14]|nr:MAG: hypothetical protein UV01_C0015G0039 [Parcubacteria group bacterium GW2011_GWA2_42_14]